MDRQEQAKPSQWRVKEVRLVYIQLKLHKYFKTHFLLLYLTNTPSPELLTFLSKCSKFIKYLITTSLTNPQTFLYKRLFIHLPYILYKLLHIATLTSGEADVSWEEDPLAGIIPRAMSQLFECLDNQV